MARVEGSGSGRGVRHRGEGNSPAQHYALQHTNGNQGNGMSSSMQDGQVSLVLEDRR